MTKMKPELAARLNAVGTAYSAPVIFLLRGRTFLSGLRHYTPEKWKKTSVWTTPGGRCDAGETLEQALRREVREETGITDFAVTDCLGEFPGSRAPDVLTVFIGRTGQEPRLMEPDKFSEWRWLDVDKAGPDFINQEVLEALRDWLARG